MESDPDLAGVRGGSVLVGPVTYRLGIDVGTTFTAAAVRRAGRTSLLPLGQHGAEIPSVLFLRENGTFAVGEAAERRGLAQPQRLVREFKRRTGDPTPVLLAGSPFSPHALTAELLQHVVGIATEREGGPPSAVVLTHPAHWGPHKLEQLQHAVELADLPTGTALCPEPVAALLGYAQVRPVDLDAVYAVYDLGGGTFDAAVVTSGVQGVRLRGRPAGVDQLGGVDFDDALFHEVLRRAGVVGDDLAEDPAVGAALARLRRDCVAAKEALSDEHDITLAVTVPVLHASVRVTRADFEDLVRPTLTETVTALHRALASAEVAPDDLDGVLLAGGSSRIPLVTELLAAELGRPLLRDAHPKHLVPLGAAGVPSERPAGPDDGRRSTRAGRTPTRGGRRAPQDSAAPDEVGGGAPGGAGPTVAPVHV